MTEQRYFDALKHIAQYESPDRLRKSSERRWGLSYDEALEMAYDNILLVAKTAIKGKRRPKEKP